MSYGHADKINEQTGHTSGQSGQTVPVDPALWDRPEMRPVLSTRDITTLYQVLIKAGMSQHRIAKLTGQTQSEVCEILKGRRVLSYDVLVRIAEGLRIPRELMASPTASPAPTVGRARSPAPKRLLRCCADI